MRYYPDRWGRLLLLLSLSSISATGALATFLTTGALAAAFMFGHLGN